MIINTSSKSLNNRTHGDTQHFLEVTQQFIMYPPTLYWAATTNSYSNSSPSLGKIHACYSSRPWRMKIKVPASHDYRPHPDVVGHSFSIYLSSLVEYMMKLICSNRVTLINAILIFSKTCRNSWQSPSSNVSITIPDIMTCQSPGQ